MRAESHNRTLKQAKDGEKHGLLESASRRCNEVLSNHSKMCTVSTPCAAAPQSFREPLSFPLPRRQWTAPASY